MSNLLKISCECDDGYSIVIAVTGSTTCRDLANQLCQLRNTQDASNCTFSPEDLSLVITNELDEIICLLSPDVSVKKTLDKRTSLKVLGWQYRRREWEEAIAAGLEPPRKRIAMASPSVYTSVKTDDNAANKEKHRLSNGQGEAIEGEDADDGDSDEENGSLTGIKRKSLSTPTSSTPVAYPSAPFAKHTKAELRHLFMSDPVELDKLRALRTQKSEGVHDNEWDDRLDLLMEYGRVKGNFNPPKSTICIMADNSEVRLGKWVQRQRAARKRGTLRADRLERLQALVDSGKLVWSTDSPSYTQNSVGEGVLSEAEAPSEALSLSIDLAAGLIDGGGSIVTSELSVKNDEDNKCETAPPVCVETEADSAQEHATKAPSASSESDVVSSAKDSSPIVPPSSTVVVVEREAEV